MADDIPKATLELNSAYVKPMENTIIHPTELRDLDESPYFDITQKPRNQSINEYPYPDKVLKAKVNSIDEPLYIDKMQKDKDYKNNVEDQTTALNNIPEMNVEDYYEKQLPGLYKRTIPSKYKLPFNNRSKSVNKRNGSKFYYPKLTEQNLSNENEEKNLLPPIISVNFFIVIGRMRQ